MLCFSPSAVLVVKFRSCGEQFMLIFLLYNVSTKKLRDVENFFAINMANIIKILTANVFAESFLHIVCLIAKL